MCAPDILANEALETGDDVFDEFGLRSLLSFDNERNAKFLRDVRVDVDHEVLVELERLQELAVLEVLAHERPATRGVFGTLAGRIEQRLLEVHHWLLVLIEEAQDDVLEDDLVRDALGDDGEVPGHG